MSIAVKEATQLVDLAELTKLKAMVEDYMASWLDGRSLPANLSDAIVYALLGSGKRLRPILVLQACQAVGGTISQALPAAAGIEMIHCFSLVHDDLPAMDDDDLRRGRPTLHKHTNQAMAILAGDAMLGLALECVAGEVKSAELAKQLLFELSQANNDMIAGQVYDTLPDFPQEMEPIDRLELIHRHKTGALIRCACRMGAMVGGASPQQLQAITRYGQVIGLMFQVVDDLLDVTQTTEQLGKAAQKDEDKGKLTYPSLLGVAGTQAQVQQLCDQAIDALSDLGQPAQPLRDLCQYMAVRTK